jgi:hypothetical protein
VTLTFDLENQWGSRFSYGLSMYQVWSKSIEECWFSSVHKNVTWQQIWLRDLDLWPWKSIGFQILLRTKMYQVSLVKIHWKMLIREFSQGCYGRAVALLYPFATSLDNYKPYCPRFCLSKKWKCFYCPSTNIVMKVINYEINSWKFQTLAAL